MIKMTIVILCMCVCMWIGFGLGLIAHPYLRQVQYSLGIVPFCQLIEADRFKVCPLVRLSYEVKEGGTVTLYVCDRQHAFIETNNVPKKSPTIKGMFKMYENKGKRIVSKCTTKYGAIYKLVDK